ncbi:hypothetical protein ATKI12_8347 [Kitasatospora sp. Ki12]
MPCHGPGPRAVRERGRGPVPEWVPDLVRLWSARPGSHGLSLLKVGRALVAPLTPDEESSPSRREED